MTVEELVAELNRVNADIQCPICGNGEWEVVPTAVIVPALSNGSVDVRDGPPCLAIFCTYCGYARFHSTKLLESKKP